MIHLSLPLRPKTVSQAETLITPLSIYQGTGKRILSLTTMNSEFPNYEEYSSILNQKIGTFDANFYDSDHNFLSSFQNYMMGVPLQRKEIAVLTCVCGKFEELPEIRMFNQKRVLNGCCTYCDAQLLPKVIESLVIDTKWQAEILSFNKRWVKNDYEQFTRRQTSTQYRLSKNSEKTRLIVGENNYGVRHQFVWAYGLVYLSMLHNSPDIVIHFVHRVSDTVFLCASLAKMLKPDLNINLNGLPSVWLSEKKSIIEASSIDLLKIMKGFSTSRKELQIN